MIQRAPRRHRRTPLTPEQQQLFADNIRLAYKFSRTVRAPGDMSREEWQAECLYALVLAVETWNPSRGALSTMVHYLVRYARFNHIRRLHTKRRGFGQTRALGDLEHHLGREADLDSGMEMDEVRVQADRLISTLPAIHQQVIRGRMAGRTLKDIGSDFGVTRERARQIEFEAMRRMFRFARVNEIQRAC